MSAKTFYLIRHAQPNFPGGEKMCLGQRCDLPLSPQGLKQAELLGRIFTSLPLEAVYCSPLLRARQTAAPIASGQRPLHIAKDLTELDGGAWDGMPFSQIRSAYPDYYAPGAYFSAPPGGESDARGAARAMTALADIESRTQGCAAIVAHSGINCLLLCTLLGKPYHEKKQFRHGYGAISELSFEDGVWRVIKHGILPEDWI